MMNYRGTPCIWQIIKRIPQPVAVRNFRFRSMDRTAHFRALYSETKHSECLPF